MQEFDKQDKKIIFNRVFTQILLERGEDYFSIDRDELFQGFQEYLENINTFSFEHPDESISCYLRFFYIRTKVERLIKMRQPFRPSFVGSRLLFALVIILIEFMKEYIESTINLDMEQKIIKLSSSILTEDLQSVLGDLITRENRSNRSPLKKNTVIIYLFLNTLWGGQIVPYFQNKFLPSKNKVD